ncbi:MAG: tRNA (N(6)-L-threonylcarbamoyladenosine(37)-C(2))-methylthiotransferase MtaB [Clostridia bacterium]|nr:tRNA (N(6)-L-threonylcarbamoyladenosine(37)-C(2))-methylthiotransferase MtaB [Clostridia bacterium]
MRILFYTLGCKVNQYETKAMRRLLEQAGHVTEEEASSAADWDAVVVNSCTVTAESDRKLRQLMRRIRREAPTAALVLTGCMPQAHKDADAAFPEVDILLGNAARRQLPALLADFFVHRNRIVSVPPHTAEYEPLEIEEFQGRTRAYVKIQDGCNRFCSYCIIPYARGRVRSRPLADIRRELTQLAEKGYKEMVLVGINLTAYGQDCGLSIADAVETACAVLGLQRIRLGSLEPDYMTPAVLDRLQAQPKLCPQFHLALQSGCDATLKRMNRHYTTAEYAALCEELRRRFPHCALTTDIMVGFPGETEEDFQQSCEFAKDIGFARAHVFAYSRRPGTVADKLQNQIDRATKSRRSRQMAAVCRETATAYAAKYIGRVVDVLLETDNGDGTYEGHTDTYLTVRVRTDKQSGAMVPVRITAYDGEQLVGEEA